MKFTVIAAASAALIAPLTYVGIQSASSAPSTTAQAVTSQVIFGCWKPSNGAMKVKAVGSVGKRKCPSGTSKVTWNATGPEGIQGPAGPQGPEGDQGLDGLEGPQGPRGVTGLPGSTGAQGDDGPAGAEGAPGAPGATGPTGPAGPTGAAGPSGVSHVYSSNSTSGIALAAGKYSVQVASTFTYATDNTHAYIASPYSCFLAGNAATAAVPQFLLMTDKYTYDGQGHDKYVGFVAINVPVELNSTATLSMQCNIEGSANAPSTLAPTTQTITAMQVDAVN